MTYSSHILLLTLTFTPQCNQGGDGGSEPAATSDETSSTRPAESQFEDDAIAAVKLENGTHISPSNSALEGSSISFPPGALAIDDPNTTLFVEQAAPLHQQGVLSDMNIAEEAQVNQQGNAILAVPSKPVSVVQPFQIALAADDNVLALVGTENVAVLYKTVTGTAYASGLIPYSQLTVEGNQIIVQAQAFGAYQLVQLSRSYETTLAATSQLKSIANIAWENATDADGLGQPLVSLRPLPRTYPLEVSAEYRHYINGPNAAAFPLRGKCSEAGATISISGDFIGTATCENYSWSLTADLSTLTDGEVTIQLAMIVGSAALDEETFKALKDTNAPGFAHAEAWDSNISGSPVEVFFNVSDLYQVAITKNSGPGIINFGLHTESSTYRTYRVSVDTAGTYEMNLTAYDLAENTTSLDITMAFQSASAVVDPVAALLSITNVAGETSVSFSLTPKGDFDHNASGFGGYLIVRRAASAVTWTPTDGQTYTVGTFVDSDHKIVAKAANPGGITDSGLSYGQTYHYTAFSYNVQNSYSSGNAASVAIQVLTNTQVGWAGGYMVDAHIYDDKLFIAKDSRGLEIYDISTGKETAPDLLGGLDRDDDVKAVFATDVGGTTYAFLVEDENGLSIVDISTPTNMTVVGTLTPETFTNYTGVYVEGDYAYLTSSLKFNVIDINPPSTPTNVGSLNFSFPGGVYVDGNTGYVAGSGFISTIDLTTKTSPSISDTYSNGSFGFHDITKISNDLFVTLTASGNDGIVKIGVSDPADISADGWYTPAGNGGNATNIDAKGSNPIFALGTSGVYTADTTPASPGGTSAYDTPGTAKAVSVNGNYAYVADNDAGLRVLDVTSVSSVSSAGSIATLSNAEAVDVSGNYAYVADAWNGLIIYDISTLATPSLVGQYSVSNGYAYDVKVVGTDAYVAFDDEGAHRVDVSTVSSPVQGAKDDAIDDIGQVVVAGSNVVFGMNTGSGSGGIYVKNSGMSTVGSLTGFDPLQIAYDGSQYLYAVSTNGSNEGTLRVIDLGTPASPNQIKTFALGTVTAAAIDHNGDHVYVAIEDTSGFPQARSLQIIDVSTPSSPSTTSSINISDSPKDVLVSGDLVHIAEGGTGVALINIEDMDNPFAYGTMQVSYDARGLTINGDYVYVADGYDGITIHSKITP